MTSAFKCCIDKRVKTLDHVFSIGLVAHLGWKKAALTLEFIALSLNLGRLKSIDSSKALLIPPCSN